MENAVILDTSVVIELLRGNESIRKTVQELARGKNAVITAITKYEVLAGLKEEKRSIMELVPCVDFGCKTARIADELSRSLRKMGLPASLPDTLIAAKAKEMDAVLVTRDKGFQRFVQLGVKVIII